MLEWLARADDRSSTSTKLTYAGNLRNLDAVQGDRRHVFVHGDYGNCGPGGTHCWLAPAAGRDQLCRRGRMWTAPSTAPA